MYKSIASIAVLLILNSTLLGSIPSDSLNTTSDSTACNKDITFSFVRTAKKTYQKNNNDIEIVFNGVFVEYAFEQIGYVEVSGTDSSDINDLIECLKSVASINGADAVINIKRQDIKNRPSFNGILIKYVPDDESRETSTKEEAGQLVIKNEPGAFEKFLKIAAGALIFSIILFFELHYNDKEDEEY